VLKSGEYVPKADIPKLVRAEIESRNAKAREGKTNLPRVEGTPTGTTDEVAWWRGLSAEERRDRANIARFDRYTAGLR
jgi:hypothetical protein